MRLMLPIRYTQPLLRLVLFCSLLGYTQHAHAMEHGCRALFSQKQFARAGSCYAKLVPKVDKQTKLHPVHMVLKNRYLEQAAIAYNQAARHSTKTEEKGFYRETAVTLLQTAVKKQYCKAANRCTNHQLWIAQLQKEIRYTPVTIITGRPTSQITIEGYHYRKQTKGRFVQRLRPGMYTLIISVPSQKQKILVRADHQMLINAKERRIKIVEKQIFTVKKGLPPFALIGTITGGVLLAVGAVIGIIGISQQNGLNQVRRDPLKNKEQTDEAYDREFNQAQVLTGIGFITAGTGGLLLIGSALAASLAKPNLPPKSKGSTLFGSFSWKGETFPPSLSTK